MYIDSLEISDLTRDLLEQLLCEKEDRPSAEIALKHPAFNVFYPSMCDFSHLPDFSKNVRIGNLEKEGKTLRLQNHSIAGKIFFKDGRPISKHLILHKDLRVFKYMLVIAEIYLKRFHSQSRKSNDSKTVSTFNKSGLTNANAWTNTSFVIPQLKYFFHKNWMILNTMIYSVVFLLENVRIEFNTEELHIFQNNCFINFRLQSLLDGSDTVNRKQIELLKIVLDILLEARKTYK